MVLDDQELLQIDERFIRRLLNSNPAALAGLSVKLLNDLKEARERLNQSPSNSSKPPSSRDPWDMGDSDGSAADSAVGGTTDSLRSPAISEPEESDAAPSDEPDNSTDPAQPAPTATPKRKPGRQKGSPGHGRTQCLPVTDTVHHLCGRCTVCQHDLSCVEKAYTGFYCVNVIFGDKQLPGLQLTNTHNIYYHGLCPACGLENRSKPWRAPPNHSLWQTVGMTQWRLIGPDLAAMIVYLSMDMRITRRKLQRLLDDLFGLQVSIGSIQKCLIESARALAPVENQILDELLNASVLHADETAHREAGQLLWLWVFISQSCALYVIGKRTKEMFTNMLESGSSNFNGYLMSDGYASYRSFRKRLRCWAHLQRKADGLAQCYTPNSRLLGQELHAIFDRLIHAIYEAREGPDKGTKSIVEAQELELDSARTLCEAMANSAHKKTRELGREILNDWQAIFRVLEHPAWPITNNEAERALRHWVIMRKITQGTRSEHGSRALALFASVIETCRLRSASPLLYIRDVITERRRGADAPALPVMPTSVAAS